MMLQQRRGGFRNQRVQFTLRKMPAEGFKGRDQQETIAERFKLDDQKFLSATQGLSQVAKRTKDFFEPIVQARAGVCGRADHASVRADPAKFERCEVHRAQAVLLRAPPQESLGVKGPAGLLAITHSQCFSTAVFEHGRPVTHREAIIQPAVFIEPRRVERSGANPRNGQPGGEVQVHARVDHDIKSLARFLQHVRDAIERMKLAQAVSKRAKVVVPTVSILFQLRECLLEMRITIEIFLHGLFDDFAMERAMLAPVNRNVVFPAARVVDGIDDIEMAVSLVRRIELRDGGEQHFVQGIVGMPAEVPGDSKKANRHFEAGGAFCGGRTEGLS